MPERRHRRQQRRLDVLARDEQVDLLVTTFARGLDEVFALDHEQPELVAPPAVAQLANELELLVVR